jgi:4-hydroxybenzoate polyprenyltransferase
VAKLFKRRLKMDNWTLALISSAVFYLIGAVIGSAGNWSSDYYLRYSVAGIWFMICHIQYMVMDLVVK